MIRLPAVAGQFYPANPLELSALIHKYTNTYDAEPRVHARACLVPHAGYVYSGHVAGAVFRRIDLPKKILILGVRHYPRGEPFAILSEGVWRTPLGDAPIDSDLALRLRQACPSLREDSVAHSREHSLEVEIPFLQELDPPFSFVPVAIGTIRYEELVKVGEGIGSVLSESEEEVLVVTSSDMNHYEDDETTRWKDHRAIECLLKMDAARLFQVCREEEISMCGLGPAVVMLTAMKRLGVKNAEVVRYATSGDVSEDRSAVVGYAGMIFY
jgi:MEMO1 family protein